MVKIIIILIYSFFINRDEWKLNKYIVGNIFPQID